MRVIFSIVPKIAAEGSSKNLALRSELAGFRCEAVDEGAALAQVFDAFSARKALTYRLGTRAGENVCELLLTDVAEVDNRFLIQAAGHDRTIRMNSKMIGESVAESVFG